MKVAKIIAIVLGVLVVIAGSLALYLTWEGDSSEIKAKADAIQVPAGWKLTSETIVAPKRLCLEKTGCPSIERRWKLDRIYTKEEIEKMFQEAGISLKIEQDHCEPSKTDMSLTKLVCTGDTAQNDNSYTLYQYTNKNTVVTEAVLLIKPRAH